MILPQRPVRRVFAGIKSSMSIFLRTLFFSNDGGPRVAKRRKGVHHIHQSLSIPANIGLEESLFAKAVETQEIFHKLGGVCGIEGGSKLIHNRDGLADALPCPGSIVATERFIGFSDEPKESVVKHDDELGRRRGVQLYAAIARRGVGR